MTYFDDLGNNLITPSQRNGAPVTTMVNACRANDVFEARRPIPTGPVSLPIDRRVIVDTCNHMEVDAPAVLEFDDFEVLKPLTEEGG